MSAIKKASDAWHCEAKILVFSKPLDVSYLLPFAGLALWMEFWGQFPPA